eukprot:COSAG06_NODE_530_length_14570_cov_23.269435_5_plen_51_part_00
MFLQVLAERPKHLRSILVTPEYNPAGAYAVRLYASASRAPPPPFHTHHHH